MLAEKTADILTGGATRGHHHNIMSTLVGATSRETDDDAFPATNLFQEEEVSSFDEPTPYRRPSRNRFAVLQMLR